MFREELIQAIYDYRRLLNRNYPQRNTIKLVGDRYKLTGEERSILYRGVSNSGEAASRRSKVISFPSVKLLALDSYNILFSLSNYLSGRPVFISDDGVLRDCGEKRGRIGNRKVFAMSVKLLKDFIIDHSDHEFYLLFDEPVSNSGKLALEMTGFLNESGIKGIAETVRSPDYVLQRFINATVCSSDSVIMDHIQGHIFDLPFQILTHKFSPVIPKISEF